MPAVHPPIQEILPHRGSMLLVERVLDWDADSATVAATPDAAAWYAEPGGMPSWVGVELIAQAIAAHVGLVAHAAGKPPRRGVLLGTRAYHSTLARFPAGAELAVSVRQTFADAEGLAAYDGSIRLAGAEVAAASVTVYEPADFEAFIARAGRS